MSMYELIELQENMLSTTHTDHFPLPASTTTYDDDEHKKKPAETNCNNKRVSRIYAMNSNGFFGSACFICLPVKYKVNAITLIQLFNVVLLFVK